MVMAMELAMVMHRERLEEADARRRRRAQKEQAKDQARKRNAAEPGPKIEWPILSIRIGRFQFVAYRTTRL